MYHYKELNPKQTIENVKNFFNKKSNFYLKLNENYYNEESLTWWCSISLYYKNKEFLRQEGKGLTKELSLASGYMETFERYCSCYRIYKNPLLKNKKILSSINDYISLQSNNIKHFSISNIYSINGTTGLAAGNNLNEAITQGISEIAERYCLKLLFEYYNSYNFYALNKNNLNLEILHIIKNIEEIYKTNIIIYDLSYTFNLPVCMVVIFDPISMQIRYRLGSHPIFEIALERCITELYQHIQINNHYIYHQQPFLNNNSFREKIVNSMTSAQSARQFPENILNNYILKDYHSSIYCVQKINNNNDFINYYNTLFNNLNLSIYYHILENNIENSLAAVHVFVPEVYEENKKIFKNDILIEETKIYLNNLITKIFNRTLTINDLKTFDNYNLRDFNYYFKIYYDDFIIPSMIKMLKNKERIEKTYLSFSVYGPYIAIYYLLQDYINSKQYTNEEIISIFKNFNINITLEDIYNINNTIYILYKYLFNYLIDDYNNFDLNDFIIE